MKITDPVMVRSLLRDGAAHYLAPFLHEDHSVSEAAELLRTPLTKVHYWVRSLCDAGLLHVVSEQPRKGRPIKRYRAIATEFVVPAEALPEDYFAGVMRRSNEDMIDALAAAAPEWVIGGDFRVSASSPTRGSQDRVLREGTGLAAVTHQSGCSLRITEDEARELAEEIRDLRDRWIARSADESDLERYQLDIALAPMPD
ncbi:hypothetical protein [Flexivirga oryzae]|uniref:ArsR family transcriptional regulator n=1 Tax=Flexivirga oryzae TaxID=1794944 RepID=A0A839N8F7_9MICO|nr:hypothetical protein [Flexivirga oryzae]MBB2893517.1 hypothetical protein [Flexivirga oryzae]